MDLEKMSENLGLPVDTQLDEHIQPLDNTRLEQAIIRVKTQNDRENMMAMMKALTRAELLVCTALTDISREQADGIERGETVRLEGPRSFQPMVLQRADGSCVMPLYTSREQIPAYQRGKLYMRFPFVQCAELAAKAEYGLAGIVVNPHTDGLTLPTELLRRISHAGSTGA